MSVDIDRLNADMDLHRKLDAILMAEAARALVEEDDIGPAARAVGIEPSDSEAEPS